jgi:hypothetical protein
MSKSKTEESVMSEFEKMLKTIKDTDLSELSPDKIINIKKGLNPYGRTIEGSDKFLNFSITQIQHEYWKKLIITGFVGFLNRMVDEWKVPDGIPVVSVYEYLEDKSKLDTPQGVLEKGDKSTQYDYDFNRKWMEKRIVVKQFLEEFLQFNPDEHVRSAYRVNRGDNTRKPIETMAGKLATQHLMATDKEFRAREELYQEVQAQKKQQEEKKEAEKKQAEEQKVLTKKVKKIIKGRDGKNKTILVEVPIGDTTKKLVDGKDPTISTTVREFIPPHDTFGRFKLYLHSNYEELRDATNDLFCEKPEFELAINPYSWHDTEDEAELFKKKHRNEVIAEVFTAHSGKWNFFDSFKEQRENVNFYNDKTIILEEMIKQQKRDEELGRDLMKKRIDKVKRKNIIEAGPDAESFKKWRAQNSEISKIDNAYIGDQADAECPDDGVQVDVWKVSASSLQVTKDKFYSLAEAPTFVKEAQDRAIASGEFEAPGGLPQTEPKGKTISLPMRADNL